MDWKKLIGYGVGVYTVIFMLWSLLVAFGQGEAAWAWYVSLIVLAMLAHFVGAKLGTKDWKEIIKYSAGWVAIMAVLDAVVTTRFTGWDFYSSWEVYVAYTILLLVPLTVICCKGKCCHGKSAPAPAEESTDNSHEGHEHNQM